MAIPEIRQSWPETLSAQEIFDHVLTHLRAQEGERSAELVSAEKRSLDDSLAPTKCVYRDPNGRACAAGALLTDAEAARISPELQMYTWGWLVAKGLVPSRLDPFKGLIHDLQDLHDRDSETVDPKYSCGIKITRDRIERIAHRYNLSYVRPAGQEW